MMEKDRLVDAAVCGAQFLRSLPEEVDPYSVLKSMGEALGDELVSEIMREILNPHRSNMKYIGKADPNGHTKIIEAIKQTRAIIGCSLKEAKDFIEGTQPLEMTADAAQRLNRETMPCEFAVKRWYL